ncbi:MAG: ISKra4 family transposase, partial [Cyanobacteria bacterium J06648_11]
FELLKSQGMQMNQQVTFLSDGGDTVRDLQLYLNPQAEHLLDWFHVTMRLTVMTSMAKGVHYPDDWLKDEVNKTLESIKWYLWHGNVFRALQEIDSLIMSLYTEETSSAQAKLLKTAEEFLTYITNNQQFITNYGERYRNGERISTGFVESTVNQVISKRMVKKQQMRWSRKGAHLLLQVRTRVLDDDWRDTFDRWYPVRESQAA